MRSKRILFKRFEKGTLMKTLKDFIDSKKIKSGLIFVIGFLDEVTLGFFDWKKKDYEKFDVKKVEIVSCYGNLSRKEKSGDLLIHMHGVFAKEKGKTYGGHVVNGRIKLIEVMIIETEKVTRIFDEKLGLYLLDV